MQTTIKHWCHNLSVSDKIYLELFTRYICLQRRQQSTYIKKSNSCVKNVWQLALRMINHFVLLKVNASLRRFTETQWFCTVM